MASPEKYLTKLPEEMLVEILAKLSDKSLVRSTCVCKALHDLIMTNPSLHEKYTNILRDHYCTINFFRQSFKIVDRKLLHEDFLLIHDSRNPLSLEFNRLSDVLSDARVIGSCDGILFCFKQDNFYLHNPITRQVLQLPPIRPCTDDTGVDVGLDNGFYAFFGIDSRNNDYKVILRRTVFNNNDDVLKTCVDIFKLSTNCWSELDDDFEFGRYSFGGLEGLVFKGFFHRLVTNSHCSRREARRERICTFDFSAEKFGMIEYPVLAEPWKWWGQCLAVLDDSLSLCLRQSMDKAVVEIWVMTEFGKWESWTKKFCVKLVCEMRNVLSFWVNDMSQLVVFGGYMICDESEDFDATRGRWVTVLQEEGKYVMFKDYRGGCVTSFAFQPNSMVPGSNDSWKPSK